MASSDQMKLAALLATVVSLTACGATGSLPAGTSATPVALQSASAASPSISPPGLPRSSPTESAASPTRVTCPDVQPVEQFTPARPSSRKLALVWMGGDGSQYVVRDVTDINHPFTVASPKSVGGGGGAAAFISAEEIAWDFVRTPLAGKPATQVMRCVGNGGLLAWNADGTKAAYLVVQQDGQHVAFHLIAGGQDRKVATLSPFPWGTGCESVECADRLDMQLLFSPDGRYISFVQNWGGPLFRIWKADGSLLKSIDRQGRLPAGAPTMSVWSGANLYYRDDNGVEVWHDGNLSLLLRGVKWIRPHGSPVGGQIVFETRNPSGAPVVSILDTASGTTRAIKTYRSEPTFLTSRYLWYEGERACTASDGYPCGEGYPTTIPTGKTYIYDLETGIESTSIIKWVLDVWPHAG
jgi:hypothetical protein